MRYCQLWFTEVDIEPSLLRPCCNTSAAALPEFLVHEDDLRADTKEVLCNYFDFIFKVMNDVQQDNESAICRGCDLLMDVDESSIPKRSDVFGRDDSGRIQINRNTIQLRRVLVNHFRWLCNCKCIYCDAWTGDSILPPQIKPVLEAIFEMGLLSSGCTFAWGGGEPTILPEFVETANWIDSKGFSQQILTNAVNRSPTIEQLLQRDTFQLLVSLDSGTREKYHQIKGVDKFDSVVATLHRYMSVSAENICLKYIIIKNVNNNFADIDSFLDICRLLGAKKCLMSIDFRELGGPIDRNSLACATRLIVSAEQYGLVVDRFNIPNDLWSEIKEHQRREQNYARLLTGADFDKWLESFPMNDGIRMISTPKHFPNEQNYDCTLLSLADVAQGEGMLALLRSEGIKTDKPILELGCGTGELSIGLAHAHVAPLLLLSESSPYSLTICRDNIISHGDLRDNLHFCCLTADDMDLFPSNSLSVLCMRATLHHIADIDRFFREAARIVAPGGCIVFDEPFAEGYLLMGIVAKLTKILANDKSIALSKKAEADFDLLVDVCERFLREDFDKSGMEDKHVFTSDGLGLVMTKYGLMPKFYRNQNFAQFANGKRQKASPGEFHYFWRMYMVHLLNLGEECGEMFDRIFGDIFPFIDKCSNGTMGPACNATGIAIKPL